MIAAMGADESDEVYMHGTCLGHVFGAITS